MRTNKMAYGIGGGLLLACAAVLVAAAMSARSAPDERATPPELPVSVQGGTVPSGGRTVLDLFDEGQPLFITGSRVNSAEAAAEVVGDVVFTPASSTTTGDGDFWANEESGEVGVRYGSDLVVLQTPWPAGLKVEVGTNPYEAKAKSIGAGETSTIGGHPAFVLPKDSRESQDGGTEPPVSSVQIYVDGADVTLLSPTLSTSDLVKLAESLTRTIPSGN